MMSWTVFMCNLHDFMTQLTLHFISTSVRTSNVD